VLHQDLENRHSKLVEWAYLRAINLRTMHGESIEGEIDLMGRIQLTRRSAVLQEKLGDLYWAQKKFSAAFDSYEQVLKLEPSPMQRLRVLLTLGERRSVIGPDRMAVAFYQQLLREFPSYPDSVSVYRKLLPLARKVGDKEEAARCEREIQRMSTNAPAVKN
jgi:tetratricopeptide (TPR) repeat protein